MKKAILPILCISLLILSSCCLKHKPGKDATCTEDQVCTECGKVLATATGHAANHEASCTEDSVCTKCGEVLAKATGHKTNGASCTEDEVCTVCNQVVKKATGHTVDKTSGKCTVCGQQVADPGITYTTPGAHGTSSSDASSVLPETINSGHYNKSGSSSMSKTVLVCGDYGIEYYNLSTKGSSSYAEIINKFAAKYPSVSVTSLLVPKAATYESPDDKENPHDSTNSYIESTFAAMDSSITKVNAMTVMDQHAGEYMFYRTDHHWTSLGAYYASVAYCNAKGITARSLDSYETVIKTGVTGTLYTYSGNNSALKKNLDYTVLHFPKVGYAMKYSSNGKNWTSGVALNPNSSGYASVFMAGDQPLTVINTDVKNGKTLMVFKESYGNAFVPYMIDYYETIVVVDIRKDTPSVKSLISEYNVTDALIINNVQAAGSLQSQLQTKIMS